MNCDPILSTAGLFPGADEMRAEEIEYALSRLRTLAWVDPKNLFLMGHSEGGHAVAVWRGGGFSAQIFFTGWWCSWGGKTIHVNAPRGTPLLAINYERDPWFTGTASTCGSLFSSYKSAREVILPGFGHNALHHSGEARFVVIDFLRDHTTR